LKNQGMGRQFTKANGSHSNAAIPERNGWHFKKSGVATQKNPFLGGNGKGGAQGLALPDDGGKGER